MKQFPNNWKFRKNHKVSSSFFTLDAQKSFFPMHGNYAIKSLEFGKLNYKQIEACRKSMRRSVKKEGKVWVRVFTYCSLTKKGIGSRMGKGKGSHNM
jgi:large subunit ribosomal protein L16